MQNSVTCARGTWVVCSEICSREIQVDSHTGQKIQVTVNHLSVANTPSSLSVKDLRAIELKLPLLFTIEPCCQANKNELPRLKKRIHVS